MCQRIGRPPISTIGLGRNSVSSRMRVPWPPQSITTFGLTAVIGQSIGRGPVVDRRGASAIRPGCRSFGHGRPPALPRHRGQRLRRRRGGPPRRWPRGLPVVAAVGPHSQLDRLASVARDVAVVRADITDDGAVAAAVAAARPDTCVHLAAAGAVVREDDLDLLLAANTRAPARLARTLADAGCARLVTVGSSSEYGTVDGPMDEASACAPDDPYGVAKLAGGLLARVVAREHGLESAHLRLFSVYGPGEDLRRLVPSVVRALLARRPRRAHAGRSGARLRLRRRCRRGAAHRGAAPRHRRPDGERRHRRPDDDPRSSSPSRTSPAATSCCASAPWSTAAASASPCARPPTTPARALDWRARTPLGEGLRRTVAHERHLEELAA